MVKKKLMRRRVTTFANILDQSSEIFESMLGVEPEIEVLEGNTLKMFQASIFPKKRKLDDDVHLSFYFIKRKKWSYCVAFTHNQLWMEVEIKSLKEVTEIVYQFLDMYLEFRSKMAGIG